MRPRWLLFALIPLLAACSPRLQVAPGPLRPSSFPFPTTATVRFALIGDQGSGGREQRAVARALAQVCRDPGCDLVVGLGDNFYPAGPVSPDSPLFRTHFEDIYQDIPRPFLMIPGNHDESRQTLGGDGGNPDAADAQVAYGRRGGRWVMPGRYYGAAFPVTDAHNLTSAAPTPTVAFFALDTTPLAPYVQSSNRFYALGDPFQAAQRAWLHGALASSQARWKIVLGHHPLLSNGAHGDAGNYGGFGFLRAVGGRDLAALYKSEVCGHADLLASGHDHSLQVLKQGPACPGTRQLISGAAGQENDPRSHGRHAAAWEAFGQLGFLWVEATPDVLTLRAYTVDVSGEPTLAYEETLRK